MTRPKRALLIGPLPPPETGNRVALRAALTWLRGLPELRIDHVDMPCLSATGRLRHWPTVRALARAVCWMPRNDAVVIFGARDFCFSYGALLTACARLWGKPCAIRVMGGRALFSPARLPGALRKVLLALLGRADALVLETETARNDLPATLRAKAAIVSNWRRRPPAPPPDRGRDGIRFAFVGGLNAKGLALLLDAFVRARAEDGPVMELHVFGPAPKAEANRARQTPGVVFHGFVPNERLRAVLPRHDGLAFTSQYPNEGHPGVVIEAFMAGLPVIAGNLAPGPAEIVKHEVNGLVVKAGDAGAFADAMNRLAADPGLRQRLAAGARAAAADFDQDKVLPSLAAALGLLEQPGAERNQGGG